MTGPADMTYPIRPPVTRTLPQGALTPVPKGFKYRVPSM